MNIAIRVDSSQVIGTGHVMRCLVLGHELRSRGCKVFFVCRYFANYMKSRLLAAGFTVFSLNGGSAPNIESNCDNWIGVTQEVDAKETIEVCSDLNLDWIIVDHYSLSAKWESIVVSFLCAKVVVIDDLCDRPHMATILVDPGYLRCPVSYRPLVPVDCDLLVGAEYALLQARYSELRSATVLAQRKNSLNSILVSLGGADVKNYSQVVLEHIDRYCAERDIEITLVVGSSNPWVENLVVCIERLKAKVALVIDAPNLADLILRSDLGICTPSTTSLEFCCMGVPMILLRTASNQEYLARSYVSNGVCLLANNYNEITILLDEFESYANVMRKNCFKVTDGLGAKRVVDHMIG